MSSTMRLRQKLDYVLEGLSANLLVTYDAQGIWQNGFQEQQTTHTITGSIIGVGATKRLSAVRWGVTINLLWAWIITIPISAIMAAIVFYLLKLFI